MNKVEKYVVRFVPLTNYGVITKITRNKKEAYRLYRELKAELDPIRPGHLCILEDFGDHQRYLANYETGKAVNGTRIIKHIEEELMHLVNDIYNQSVLEKQEGELTKRINDMEHGIELIDLYKLTNEEYMEVLNQVKLINHQRRQVKNNLYDARLISKNIKTMRDAANNIKNILAQSQNYRTSDSDTSRQIQTRYIESLGINVSEYQDAKEICIRKGNLDNPLE